MTKELNRLKVKKSNPKEIIEDFEFKFTKGRAQYYANLSLERQLTKDEFLRYKALMVKLGAPQ